MSAAAYNLETRWDIPAFVWPAVLGVSVALHIGVLLYGLPNLPWNASDPDSFPETEVIIESGGPVFQEVAALEPEPTAADLTETTDIIEPIAPETAPLLSSEVDPVQPIESEPVEQSLVPAEDVVSEPVEVLAETTVDAADLIVAPEVTPVLTEEVLVSQAEPVASAEIVTAVPVEEVSQSEALPLAVIETPEQAAPPVPLAETETETSFSVLEPDVTAVLPQDIEVPLEPADTENSAVVVSEPESVSTPLVSDVSTAPPVLQAEQGTDVTLIEEIETVSVVSDAQVAEIVSGVEAEGSDPPSVSQAPDVVPIVSSEAPPAASPQEGETVEVVPNDTIALTPLQNTEIDAVAPEVQQLSTVEAEETVVAALPPSEPETAVVPSIEPESDPAVVVPPVEVATIDPLAKVTNYVGQYDFGDCAHLSVLNAGVDSAQVTAFGSGIGPFAVFDQRFKADNGYEASIQLRLVTERQCALLNALGVSEGVEAAGLVELDKTVVKSGTLATGLIQRDLPIARIAAAEADGLDLGGKGPPELYLIDDAGQIHDGREFLLPASSATTAGSWKFKVPVVLMSRSEAETALVLAIWNRPSDSQPPRFGTLPSSRIAAILAEPGVYSLAAFKVSR